MFALSDQDIFTQLLRGRIRAITLFLQIQLQDQKLLETFCLERFYQISSLLYIT